MSWETAQHVRLVETLAAEIRERHRNLYSLTLFVDLPSFRRDRPRAIGRYVPDVFAIDTPETCRIIGEAKTPIDCETQRSLDQIEAFLAHLARFPNASFYLAVPLFYRSRAESLLSCAVINTTATNVSVHVIGNG